MSLPTTPTTTIKPGNVVLVEGSWHRIIFTTDTDAIIQAWPPRRVPLADIRHHGTDAQAEGERGELLLTTRGAPWSPISLTLHSSFSGAHLIAYIRWDWGLRQWVTYGDVAGQKHVLIRDRREAIEVLSALLMYHSETHGLSWHTNRRDIYKPDLDPTIPTTFNWETALAPDYEFTDEN